MRDSERRTKILCVVVSLSVCVFFTQPLEAATNNEFLERLQGTWQGDGKAFGMPARLQMKWEWVLERKFLHLSLKTETQRDGKVQTFEGHAYYRSGGEGAYEGGWFDTRGESFPINGKVEGDSLTVLWGAPRQEQGKSVYRFLEASKLEVVDSVKQKDGTWREFGRFVVIRQ